MFRRKPATIGVLLALLASAFVFWLSAGSSTSRDVTVMFVRYRTNDAGVRFAVFSVSNHSRLKMVCPASCITVTKETGTISEPNFSGDLQLVLMPGEAGTFATVPPTNREPWRVGVSHYGEDIRNRLKIRLDMSPIDRFVPSAWRRIRSSYVWSEWIEE
jgi:hypothetical protein